MLHAVIVLIFGITALAANSPATFEADSAGNLAVTVSDSFSVHASAMVLDGFLTVGNTVNVINVANVTQLVASWKSLQGQALSSPVTIQLASGIYDVTILPNYFLLLADQPFAHQITIQGSPSNNSAVTFIGAVVLANVNQLTIQYVTFSCNSADYPNSAVYGPLNLISGAVVRVSNSIVTGACGPGNQYSVVCSSYPGAQSLLALTSKMGSAPTLHLNNVNITNAYSGIYCGGPQVQCFFVSVSILDNPNLGIQIDEGASGIIDNCVISATENAYAIFVTSIGSVVQVHSITFTGSSGYYAFVTFEYGSVGILGPVTVTSGIKLNTIFYSTAGFFNTGGFTLPSTQCTVRVACGNCYVDGVFTNSGTAC